MNRIALVTGASSGIGLAVTQDLLARGHAVIGLALEAVPIRHPALSSQIVALGGLWAGAALADSTIARCRPKDFTD